MTHKNVPIHVLKIIFLTIVSVVFCTNGSVSQAYLNADNSDAKNPASTSQGQQVLPQNFAAPAAQAAQGHSQQSKSAYVPGEVIVKFKDTSDVGDVADKLLDLHQSFESISGTNNLDKLITKHKIKKINKIFQNSRTRSIFTGKTLTRAMVQNSRLSIRQAYDQEINQIKSKLAKDKKRKTQSKAKIPYLGNIYTLVVDPADNIDEVIADIKQDPNIEYAQPNYEITTFAVFNDPYYASKGSWGQTYDDLWGLKKMQMDQAWNLADGKGVVVAVVDTGVDYNHPDLAANVWVNTQEIPGNNIDDDNNGFIDDIRGWNFVNANNNPMDGHGHGTHVSGTIAAVGNNGLGIIGVAPNAKIMPVKALSDSGSSYTSDLAKAIRYAAENGADVINNSWGCTNGCPTNPIAEDAVQYAYGLGSVVVFAAGNSNLDVMNYSPANMPEVINVAASTESDNKAGFSNFGSLLDVSAPGGGETLSTPPSSERNILSLKSAVVNSGMSASGSLIVGTNYLRQAGTSMATPHAAGVAALILQKNPGFTVEEVRQAMRKGSDDIGAPGFDIYSGYGRLNANKALQVTSPLSVLIATPSTALPVSDKNIDINGTATGPNFSHWVLDYSTQKVPGTWITLAQGTSMIQNSLLTNWDLKTVPDGTNTIRLRGYKNTGEMFEDRQTLTRDNVAITDPALDHSNYFYNTPFLGNTILTVRGTASPANFAYYNLSVLDFAGQPVNAAKISLTAGGTQSVTDDILGTWDPAGVKAGHYQIQLSVYLKDGSSIIRQVPLIFDPSLHPGWPKNFPYSSASSFPTWMEHFNTADINGDGKDEIIFAIGNSVQIMDHNGVSLPGWPQSVQILNPKAVALFSPVVGDLDGDGFPDVAVTDYFFDGSKTIRNLYIWDRNGNLLPGLGTRLKDFGLSASPVISDLYNTGKNQLIVYGLGGKVGVYDVKTDSFLPGWPVVYAYDVTKGSRSAPVVGDIDNNGTQEIVFIDLAPGKITVLKNDGTIMPGWPKMFDPNSILSNPVLGDLDNDGTLEIVTRDWNAGKVYAFYYDGSPVAGWPQTTNNINVNAPVIGDIDGDGSNEVVAGTITASNGKSYVYAWHGNGTILNNWPIAVSDTGGQRSFGAGFSAIADIDNDGKGDIIFSGDGGNMSLYAYNYLGQPISGFPKATAFTGSQVNNCAAISDFDNDGLFEILWGDYNKNLYLWDTTALKSNIRPWPMYGQNAKHSGVAVRPPHISKAPQSVSINSGSNVLFNVEATGTAPLTYQWNKNNVAIPGASTSIYNTPTLSLSDSGAKFSVTITNSTGSITSPQAIVTVLSRPPVMDPLNNVTAFVGQLLSVKVTANDADLDPMTFTSSALPAGAVFLPLGDITMNGALNSLDIQQTQQYVAKLKVDFTPTQLKLADFNQNGSVNSLDVQQMSQVVGKLKPMTTYLMVWTPTASQVGNYPMTFTATDGRSAPVSQSIVITVK